MIQLAKLQSLTTSAFQNVAHFGRIVLLVTSLGVGFAVLSSVHTRPASAAGGPAVTIANTPLPIQGSVSVNNFPATQTVNLANTPTVNLAGGSSVNVSNPLDSQTNPTPLVTLEAAQPYEDMCNVDLQQNTTVNLNICNFQTIPSGKRLVIQEFDVYISLEPGVKPVAVIVDDGTLGHSLTTTFMGNNGSQDFYATHQITRLYVSTNNTPKCDLQASTVVTTGLSTMQCTLSGYLVDSQ